MSVAAAIAKKIAIYLATKKETWVVIGSIIAGILCLALLPAIVILSMGNSMSEANKSNFDFGSMYVQQLSPEQQQQFSNMEADGQAIADALIAIDLKGEIVKAQVIYFTFFKDVNKNENFFAEFASIFKTAENDEMLISTLNKSYNLSIDYNKYMRTITVIKNISIDKNMFSDLKTKNSSDLVVFANNAYQTSWGYIPHTYGDVIFKAVYEKLSSEYPTEITDDCLKWIKRRCCDNFGLLKAYLWYDFESGDINPNSLGISDISVQELYGYAKVKGDINVIPETVGLGLIKENTIGIYVGNGEVVYAKSVAEGVVKEQVSAGGWTNWFEIPYITYGKSQKQ